MFCCKGTKNTPGKLHEILILNSGMYRFSKDINRSIYTRLTFLQFLKINMYIIKKIHYSVFFYYIHIYFIVYNTHKYESALNVICISQYIRHIMLLLQNVGIVYLTREA